MYMVLSLSPDVYTTLQSFPPFLIRLRLILNIFPNEAIHYVPTRVLIKLYQFWWYLQTLTHFHDSIQRYVSFYRVLT